jgi:CGNR zinc finger/Putative stress-induced transcription regulator
VDFGHYDDPSVDLAIDLINDYATAVRHAADDHVHPLADLTEFLRAHDMDTSGVREGDEQAVQRLADRLHTVFTVADAAQAVEIVNSVLTDAGALPQISGHDDEDWHLHYYPAGARPVDRLAVTAAMGLATVLVTAGARRLGQCAGNDCIDVYVDTSRNNRRRFCSDGCANRSHVAAHRARRRTDQPDEARQSPDAN